MSLDVDLLDAAGDSVHEFNITHNLNKMASEAGLYQAMWRPEELGATKASDLIEPLRAGVAKLAGDPVCFKQFNPENGWGKYEGLLEVAVEYLEACQRFPDATVRASR